MKHYREALIELKRRKGAEGIISNKEWGQIPTPTVVLRDAYVEKFVEEPDELFFTPDQFHETFGCTPEDKGRKCEFFDHRGQKRWGVWVREEGPLRRKQRTGAKVTHREEVDNGEDALTEDQLAKRFAVEASCVCVCLRSGS